MNPNVADILIEALPYIRSFYGTTLVVKYGGHAMVDDQLKADFARDITLLKFTGLNPVVVHGGGPQINRVLDQMGIQCKFVKGMRLTDEATMDVVEMVLGGKVNKEIVAQVNQQGGKAVGLSGKDGGLIRAKKLHIVFQENENKPPEIIDPGLVGQVERIDPSIINTLSRQGFIPIIAPVGAGDSGETFNINADLVAGSVAMALSAKRLIFLTDVDGVLNLSGDLISSIDMEDIDRMMKEKTISGGMIPKIECAGDLDLVGIWASGVMLHGFANSYGQFNWHSNHNFNFDWSLYYQNDKAVKQAYTGFAWDDAVFQHKLEHARQTLGLLAKPAKTIPPGQYRVFLTPTALQELLGLLGWGGFGLKSHRTQQTPLLKMIKDGLQLNSKVTLLEQHATGLAPMFTAEGFSKPERVTLIENGHYRDCLSNARSAKEYATTVNCAVESPQSLQLSSGSLKQSDILPALDTGVYISNLWYSNYSDRNHCRMTGMTRFACLWVENGIPIAPLNVMRFDESLYHALGDKLLDLTDTQEKLFDAQSYRRRSERSANLPGALIEGFTFTL